MKSPYWLDYLSRERTMCSPCYAEGRGWVRVGPPIPADVQRNLSAHRNRQRAAFRVHVAERHPDLRVRWTR